MKFFSSKRRVAIAAVVLLTLFVVRPGASRLKSRIIHSISAALGRSVDVGSVHIRLLPRPGFDLQNLVVYDDAAFGAEPIVRASEVTASLRVLSLLRGRLEIARLDLTEPSLNLVHGAGGHWNVEALLEHAARLPLAPTAKRKTEPRPGFPYIEATTGRINFKNGPEKKPYALTNADFSLWQESENTWGLRLKAQPFRTDMNLNDTGLLQLSGTWQRADAIRDTPLDFNIEWRQAQLGQISKLASGNDQGWRGEILVDVALKGTPGQLHIAAASSIDDFRRYDITSGKALHLAAHCDAEYSTDNHDFRQVMCGAPIGQGMVTLTGDAGFPGTHRYSLAISAENVPAAALLLLAQSVKKNVPGDLEGEGNLHANLSLASDGESAPHWKGSGEIAEFHASSASTRGELGPETVSFSLSTDSNDRRAKPGLARASAPQLHGLELEVGPIALGGGRPGTAALRGSLDHDGYAFSISGEAEIGKILRLARMAGLPAISSSAEGSANLDLQLAGNWINPGNGFSAPQFTGTAKLRNVHILEKSAGVRAEILSAEMQLLPGTVHVAHLSGNAAGTTWTGSLDLPRGCGTPGACPVQFSLNTNRVSVSDLKEWVNPSSKKRAWYRVLALGGEAHPAWWSTLRASGRLSAEHVLVHGIDATHLVANLNLDEGKLRLTGLAADALQGKHRGEWKVDFAKSPAMCSGTGSLTGLSLADVAAAMKDGWIAGTANANYELKGPCAVDFWQLAEGKLHVDVKHVVFPHVLLQDGAEELQASQIVGDAQLHGGNIEIMDSELVSPDATYRLSGTASLKREVDVKLTRTSSGAENVGYSIVGTLEAPRVSPLARTEQARLKSPATKE